MTNTASATTFLATRQVGQKYYELKDHLGNIRAVVTDKRTAAGDVEVASASNYYPFGMLQPGNSAFSKDYRFGFNGKEMDNDLGHGAGNMYDYGFRIYNPRIGKFLSVDPLKGKYPWYSPYHFAGNTPIWAIDLDGLEPLCATEKFGFRTINTKIYKYKDGQVEKAMKIKCPIAKDEFWVIKRGKGYIYYNEGESAWKPFKAYNREQLQNMHSSASIAFSEKGQEVVSKGTVVIVTAPLGGVGEAIFSGAVTEFTSQLVDNGFDPVKAVKNMDGIDIVLGAIPARIPGLKAGTNLLFQTVSIAVQAEVDFTIKDKFKFNSGKDFVTNATFTALPMLLLDTKIIRDGKKTYSFGEVLPKGVSLFSNTLSSTANELLIDNKEEKSNSETKSNVNE